MADPEDILKLPLKHNRATIARGLARHEKPEQSSSVDREGGRYGFGMVSGVSVITRGEALGHELWIDADFLSDTTAGINATDRGLKARFTHPGLSSDGLGSMLGKVHDAKTVGDRVIGDLHFIESATHTPDGDLAAYVMQLAEDAPEDFGVSIVFDQDEAASDLHTFENTQGGRFVSPDEENKNNFRHARMMALRAADVVDSPAANPDGLFHRKQEIAQEAESLLSFALGLSDERPQTACFDVDAGRLSAAVQRFLSRHSLQIVKAGDLMATATVAEPETAPAPQPTRQDFAAECKRFILAFGAKGGEWYADGKTFAECQEMTIEDLQKQLAAKDETIESLQKRIAAVDLGEKSPVGSADGTSQERGRQHGLAHKIKINGKRYADN